MPTFWGGDGRSQHGQSGFYSILVLLRVGVSGSTTYCKLPFAVLAFALFALSPAHGQTLPLYDGPSGASCDYFNSGARVKWHHRMGDWQDARGVSQGSAAWVSANIEPTNRSRVIEWDVSALARQWLRDPSANSGVLLRAVPGGPGAVVAFFSREADDIGVRPRLLLEFADGSSRQAVADADAHLDCSTVMPLGRDKYLRAGSDTSVVIRFALQPAAAHGELRRAVLQLTTTAKQFGDSVLGVYKLDASRKSAPGTPEWGIAKDYPRDRGIEKNPNVLLAEGFESQLWFTNWSDVRPELSFWPVAADEERKFEPLDGKALRVKIAKGHNLGLDISYNFKSKIGEEPDEIYFRYYIRFGDDWKATVDGGKLPGISGTYNKAGWGGRKADPLLGWSMRGGFARMPEAGNPLRDYVTLGTYAYHADAEDFWGDEWIWDLGLRGLLQRNHWYCIEQYFRINHVGASDGELKGWIDGELAIDRKGIRVRDVPDIRIEKIWMNVYHGGTAVAAADMHVYIDNVVIARRYIGPMRTN